MGDEQNKKIKEKIKKINKIISTFYSKLCKKFLGSPQKFLHRDPQAGCYATASAQLLTPLPCPHLVRILLTISSTLFADVLYG